MSDTRDTTPDIDQQLLREIRDGIRALPGNLLDRMERSRGSNLFEDDQPRRKSGQPSRARAVSGTDDADDGHPWFHPRSAFGAQLTGMENLGHSLSGFGVPLVGEIASWSASLRNLFDAFDKVKDIPESQQQADQHEYDRHKEQAGRLDPAESHKGALDDWRDQYRQLSESALDQFGKRPAWMAQTNDGIQASHADGIPVTGPTPEGLARPGLQSAPVVDEGNGPALPPRPLDQSPGIDETLIGLTGRGRSTSPPTYPLAPLDRPGWMDMPPPESLEKGSQLPEVYSMLPDRESSSFSPFTSSSGKKGEAPPTYPLAPDALPNGAMSSLFQEPPWLHGGAEEPSESDGSDRVVQAIQELKAKHDEEIRLLQDLLRAQRDEAADPDKGDASESEKIVRHEREVESGGRRGAGKAAPALNVDGPAKQEKGGGLVDTAIQLAIKSFLKGL